LNRKGNGSDIGFFVEQDLSKQKLFKRIETFTTLPIKEVDKEQQRLIWLNYTNFVKEGANLNPEARRKWLKSIELAIFLRSVRIYWPKKQ
jgi:Zn-dependent oligopeptidase